MNNKLPRMYAPTNIRFWTIRRSGCNYGGDMEIEVQVTRKCMRVKIPDGWKWQICNMIKLRLNDHTIDDDKETLDAYIDELDFEVADA